jgi:hypothetical protein
VDLPEGDKPFRFFKKDRKKKTMKSTILIKIYTPDDSMSFDNIEDVVDIVRELKKNGVEFVVYVYQMPDPICIPISYN